MSAFLLVVFDGLRPDMIEPSVTPNLVRFGGMGTRLPAARSVFPSETRVCSASVTTGCHPGRHGIVANRLAHPSRPGAVVDTGDVAALRALAEEIGSPLVQVPTLGERLSDAGRSFAVLSSGSTGQTYVLNPYADALGQVSLSGHGAAACSECGRDLLARLPRPPKASPERAAWVADVFRTELLPAPPDMSIVWLCEPDTTSHYGGLGSAAQKAALHTADAAFGRILDDWETGPQRERLQIMVASDHGHTTVTGHLDTRAALGELADSAADLAGCTVLAGSSGGIVVPDGDAERIARVAARLTTMPWIGSVFAASGVDLPAGVLPRAAALVEHPRAAQVLYTLRSDDTLSAAGLPGTSLLDGNLVIGAGTHGGLSRAEMRTVMMLAGSRIRRGWVSDWPAGLIDIAPSALALLGVGGAPTMDGRVLTEALINGEEPSENRAPETWEAGADGYSQVLARVRLGRHVWIDAAERYGA
jgi:hypothetical protein